MIEEPYGQDVEKTVQSDVPIVGNDASTNDSTEKAPVVEEIENDEDILKGKPLPENAPRNWSALIAIFVLIVGFVMGFAIPVIGFVFYILAGFIALIFALVSVITFRKYGIPGPTVGVLICSLFLLGWGIFHLFMFTSTAMSVLSFLSESGIAIEGMAQTIGVEGL